MTNSSKKKLVFISCRYPFPTLGGLENTNLQLLRFLSIHFDVSAHFCEYRDVSKKDIGKLEKLGVQVHIHKLRYLDAALGILMSFTSGLPVQCGLFFSKKAADAVRADLISAALAFCSHIRTAPYITNCAIPTFFSLSDSVSQIYKHNMSITSGWRRLGYKIELPRLLKLEKQIANKSAGMFLFNQVESAYFDCPNVYTVPHGVNQELFSVKSVASDYSDGVSLIGKMDILHNRDMVRWFASEVMPLLPSTIKFYIIGAHPTKEILNLSIADPRIIVKGFMENPYPVIRSSIACICPMQTGGGIQNKIIEAMAVGALVVSSPRAMLPLKEPEDSGILICSKSSEWANQIMDICKTPENYLANRSMARRYAKKHFSWDSFGNEILEVINKSVSYK